MRCATIVVSPTDGGLHPIDEAIAAEPSVSRERIHRIELLADDTCVILYEVRGELETGLSVLEGQETVLEYELADADRGLVYVHFEPTPRLEALLSVDRSTQFVMLYPLTVTHDGSLRITIVGDESTLRSGIADLPAGIDLELERVGDFQSTPETPAASLTDRQREVLRTALRMGYYEIPRRTTHEEIGATLDVAGITVGEHLRRVENKVLSSVLEG